MTIFQLSLHQADDGPHVCHRCGKEEADPFAMPGIVPPPMRLYLAEEPLCLVCVLRLGDNYARALWGDLGTVLSHFDDRRKGLRMAELKRRREEAARLEAERLAGEAQVRAEAARKAARVAERDRVVALLADDTLPAPPAGFLDRLFKKAPKASKDVNP
jgi:hypothetical protein